MTVPFCSEGFLRAFLRAFLRGFLGLQKIWGAYTVAGRDVADRRGEPAVLFLLIESLPVV
jgi:hypothetical protein